MKYSLKYLLSLILIGLVSAPLLAQTYQLGDKIAVIKGGKLKPENGAEDEVVPGQVLKMAGIKENSLLVSNGKPGWLDKSQVIPLAQAAEHFQ